MLAVIEHDCSEGGYPAWADDRGREHPCPNDGSVLECIIDYIGGGSHYWTLQCPVCGSLYFFDTYRFRLSNKQDIVAYAIDNGINSVADIAALEGELKQ